ncbi:MAG: class I SAM-dependent methyltransferase [Planctomycetota bacterium]|nr:class I SAM-dependent methyltransferase [Planctomycetota bacterium]
MESLTKRTFWDFQYEHSPSEVRPQQPIRDWVRRRLRRARAHAGAGFTDSYCEYLLWRRILEHLPTHSDWSALEVGCAPGKNLVLLHHLLGYRPFGVEYSSPGVRKTRETLARHGLDPENVIECDFFSELYQSQQKEYFDVVLSVGFIEHFSDTVAVVKTHVNLLKKGGYLVCTIPNLRNMTYPFLGRFFPDILGAHNTRIMRLGPFRALFKEVGLEAKFCGYSGVFGFTGLGLKRERSFRGLLARGLDCLGSAADQLLILGLRGRSIETVWSPSLVYIGQRTK